MFFKRRLQWRVGNERTNHCTGLGKGGEIVDVNCCDGLVDFCGDPIVIQKIPKCLGRRREPTRYPHARDAKLADQLSK